MSGENSLTEAYLIPSCFKPTTQACCQATHTFSATLQLVLACESPLVAPKILLVTLETLNTYLKFCVEHSYDTPNLWSKISSSAWLVGDNPSSLLDLPSGLLFSREAVVKSLTCNDLDLDDIDFTQFAPAGKEVSMASVPSLEKSNLVPLQVPEAPPPAPTHTPWLLAGLMLMDLNA
ncbi:hypothetical protein DSO57_1032445 [Entomophthora muscae]|uniref:Uncharacterized protein n=1 Tax=Entomophthora muscae TaxID=34485 RepID=A0ACC2S293_9FUNG|nr:hypothetical protein DSO57_1032445 [Entomophthora muscae]